MSLDRSRLQPYTNRYIAHRNERLHAPSSYITTIRVNAFQKREERLFAIEPR